MFKPQRRRRPHHRIVWLAMVSAWLLLSPAAHTVAAANVVGTGTPGSCLETDFDNVFGAVQAQAGGGTITFNCGAAPVVIPFTFQKQVAAPTTIDGGGRVILSGGNTTSLFQVNASASLALHNITLTRGYGTFGAIQNFGRLDLVNSQLLNNTATLHGGAVENYGPLNLVNAVIANNAIVPTNPPGNGPFVGGGIYTDSGTTTITGSQISGNAAPDGGGGINVQPATSLTITNSQLTGNSTTATFAEGGALHSSGTLMVTSTTFDQNASSRGGGIFIDAGTAAVTLSTFTHNTAAYGGAIRHVGGTLSLTDDTFAGNGITSQGAQVTTGGGALSRDGGTATLTNVTMSGGFASYGAAIDHDSGTTVLTNVTISGNSGVGGAGINQANGDITMTNATIYGNTAPFGGGLRSGGGTMTLKNTIVAGNTTTNCYTPIASNSFSLSSDATCGFGAGRDSVDVKLGPLADNGGYTRTQLPLPGSPAVDDGTGAGCPATDQRGVTRPQGQACDVGAVEVAPADRLIKTYVPLITR